MKIDFADKKTMLACNGYPDTDELKKILKKMPIDPDTVIIALNDLRAANSPDDLPSVYHYHLLKYGLSGFAAIDVKVRNKGGRGIWRMLIEPISEDGDINNNKSITKIIIKELVHNYHKK